ncbi:MAG: DNA gyrase subunit A [Deltaproteobacteria bacterium]|nr:DNA gyrase subunit A [Deltaproteobacteria bacterium]
MTEPSKNKIPVAIEDEMRQSFMDYAMSVIIARALPDARDGLKPVHRRSLYAMYDLSNDWNRPYKKSARIVGDVIGKYHPPGDSAVYDTIVRMVQDFSLRYPLIDGQGNFGSVDGDSAAAMRYTEIRMARIASEMLADLDKETVDFGPNYDESTQEPLVLPSRIPNLLVNGSSGIAVGMATNIPPHNLGEVVDGLIALIENPDLTIAQLMQHIPGPDFPTGGFLHGRSAIREAYHTGRGGLMMRARTEIEDGGERGKAKIIVRELPYQVNKARLIERIAELVTEKRIEGISDLRDESDRDGMRVVIELKRDAVPEVVQNQLFKLSQLQDSFGVNMLAIVAGRPRLLNLKQALQVFIEHRREVVTRRTVYELRKARERLHILEGLKIALENLDAVIALIRAATDPVQARDGLMRQFGLSEIQAQAILDMRLQRLTNLERDKILEEHAEVVKQIARYEEILGDEREVSKIVVEELRAVRVQYGDPRRTEIIDESTDLSDEDLIAEADMVVTVSHEGYVKRNPVAEYRAQRRGGRGKIGATTKDEDFIEHLFVASTHAYILVFTTSGRLFWIKVHALPQAGRAARGKAIVNLLSLGADEKVSAFLPVREFAPGRYVLFATKDGTVKKTALDDYANPRPSGIIAIKLNDGDQLIGVRLTDGDQEVILSTANGQAIRFRESDVRPMGRNAAGVRGIQLDAGDAVVAVDVITPDTTLLAVAEKGYGKRTAVDEYRLTNRGGKGVITMNVTERVGRVVGVRMVREDDHVMLITDGGTVIRMPVRGISVIGRNTQGVRLIDVAEGEQVVGLACVPDAEAEVSGNDNGGDAAPSDDSGGPDEPPAA